MINNMEMLLQSRKDLHEVKKPGGKRDIDRVKRLK
jgi:hypothetical protein